MFLATLTKRVPTFAAAAALWVAGGSAPARAADAAPAGNGPAATAAVVYTHAGAGRAGNGLAQEVKLYGSVQNPQPGHDYWLKAQYRVHTSKGEIGPLMGAAAGDGGLVQDLGKLTAQPLAPTGGAPAGNVGEAPPAPVAGGPVAAVADLDVTRRDLSRLTGLATKAGSMVVRVEPQVYDSTAGKYVTAPKTDAVLLFLETTVADPHVARVQAFGEWFPEQFADPARADRAVAVLADLDAWDLSDADVAAGFEAVMASVRVTPALKAKAVAAMPVDVAKGKNMVGPMLRGLADAADPTLKAAAAAKMTAAGIQ